MNSSVLGQSRVNIVTDVSDLSLYFDTAQFPKRDQFTSNLQLLTKKVNEHNQTNRHKPNGLLREGSPPLLKIDFAICLERQIKLDPA